jgi:hypothetical protein
VKLLPAMREGDRVAVPLGGDAEISRSSQRAIPTAAAD